MPYIVYMLLQVCSIYLVLHTTMPQRSLSVYFSFPVQLTPCTKREDVIDALLCLRFKDRSTSRKRQEAYNKAQKACATFFLAYQWAHCANLGPRGSKVGWVGLSPPPTASP